MTNETDAPAKRSRIRWRMPLIITLVAGSLILFIWNTDQSRQHHILQTTITLMVASILYFLWLVLFSGLGRRTRALLFTGAAVLGLAFAGMFRISGVTGDLLPIVKPRWQKSALTEGAITTTAMSTNAIAQQGLSFPQFLGPERNGVIRDIKLETNWAAHPPKLLWRRPVGNAWSGFAVGNGIAVTQEQREQGEAVAAYNLTSGAPIWTHLDEGRHFTTLGGEGPRATPTIHSNRVYVLGALGTLNCLDLTSGQKIWAKNLTAEFETTPPEWGYAGSPLIVSNMVIVPANSSKATLAAFDVETGKSMWSGGAQNNGYSSPTLVTLAGETQVISFNNRNISAHAPGTGSLLWEYPWPASHPHVTMPIAISTNTLLASSGYGYGSELIEVNRTGTNFTATRVWKSNRFKSKFANMLRYGKYVYGLDDGILCGIDPEDGRRIWHDGRVGHGQMLLVGEALLLMAENGEVQLIAPPFSNTAPESTVDDSDRTITRLKVFAEKTWNPPALAGQLLLVRNNVEAACFELPLAR